MQLNNLVTVLERDLIDGKFQTHTFMMIEVKDSESYADYWLKQEESICLEPDVFDSLDNIINLLKGRINERKN